MHCIYSGNDVPISEGNMDHIIPLSLGGHDDFCVWSDRNYNSTIGGKVDGAIANDPLFMLARRNAGAIGHRGKPPVPIWKHSEREGRPVQVRLGMDKIDIWDARSRSYLEKSEIARKTITSKLQFDRLAPMRFLAKVALAGGYRICGDCFVENVNLQHLRDIIEIEPEQLKENRELAQSGIQICDRFHPDAAAEGQGHKWKALCQLVSVSILISVPHEDSISFHIGLLGGFLGSIVIPTCTKGFPFSDNHDLGHVILFNPGGIERVSLRCDLKEALQKIDSLR